MSDQHVLSGGGMSFVPHTASESFDIKTEVGTLALLKSVHRSQLEPEVKNVLRDAIFSYRQNQTPESFDEVCELFDSVGVEIVGAKSATSVANSTEQPKASRAQASKSRLGSQRPQPSFGMSRAVPTTPKEKRIHKTQSSAPPIPPLPTNLQAQESSVPTPVVEPVVSRNNVNSDNVKVVEETQSVSSEQTPVSVVAEQKPLSPTENSENYVDFTERIKVIKKSINERVGNPVHLIDTHNDIGREYMGALLEAMKKSNGGQPAELVDAMARLEKAYQSAMQFLDAGTESVPPVVSSTESNIVPPTSPVSPPISPAPPAPVPPTPATESEEAVLPVASPVPTPEAKKENVVVPTTRSNELSTTDSSPSVTPVAPVLTHREPLVEPASVTDTLPSPLPPVAKVSPIKRLVSVISPHSEEKTRESEDSAKVQDDEEFALPYASEVSVPAKQVEVEKVVQRNIPLKSIRPVVSATPAIEIPKTNMGHVDVPATPVASQTPDPIVEEDKKIIEHVQEAQIPERQPEPHADGPSPVASVAKTKQVEELLHSQMLERIERDEIQKKVAEEKMDPIMVSEVTAGLKQLLSEWDLFKSSGFFGTGPSGIDHELYKRIASLQMQAVVTGRFEGVTPQIRQSLSDYMNGWRYEEGVVHDYGETFEHYLRRVIRHIIDKQKKNIPTSKV